MSNHSEKFTSSTSKCCCGPAPVDLKACCVIDAEKTQTRSAEGKCCSGRTSLPEQASCCCC